MDSITGIGMVSAFTVSITIAISGIGPALGRRRPGPSPCSIAQQPDESSTITRTLFVGLAMVESTAIYAFVVALILLFANPFWNYAISQAGG